MNRAFDTGYSRRIIEWIDREESNLFWAACGMVLIIAGLDALVFREISLGAWYILPLLVFACVLDKVWVMVISAVFSLFREMLSNPVPAGVSAARFAVDVVLFAGAAWFVSDLISSRRFAIRLIADLQNEVALRQGAETELHLLVEMAPLSILTADVRGVIVRANAMAGTLFGTRSQVLTGMELSRLLPMMARVPDRTTTNMSAQCSAFRVDGQVFLANVWFRRMEGGQSERTVVLVSDESDNVRLRRDEALELGVSGSRALLGAVAVHVQQALESVAELHVQPANTDQLLGQLSTTLRQLLDLTPPSMVTDDVMAGPVNPTKLLQEFQAFCGPMFEDLPVQVSFDVPENLPLVSSNYSAVIQMLLVLVRLSHRHLRYATQGELRITAEFDTEHLRIRVWDSVMDAVHDLPDAMVSQPEGMPLLIARASLRGAGGDLLATKDGYVLSVPLIAPRTAGWTAASNSD